MADVATLVFDIDSSRARTAVTDLAKVQNASTKLAAEWGKTDNALRKSNGQFASSIDVASRYGDEIRRLAREFNPALNAVYEFQQAEERLNRAVALGVITVDQQAVALSRIKTQLASATTAQVKFGQASQIAGHHAQNLGYQINDIGMMMALGQNPFALMMQQGPQVAQIFSQMNAEGRKIGPTLVSAFTSLLNPTTAITLAVIGGSAALIQWATSAGEAKVKAAEFSDVTSRLTSMQSELKASQDIMSMSLLDLYNKYGLNALAVRQYATSLADLQVAQAKTALAQTVLESASALDRYTSSAQTAFSSGQMLSTAFGNIKADLGLTGRAATELQGAFQQLKSAMDFESRSAALMRIDAALKASGISAEKLPAELQKAIAQAYQAQIQMAELKRVSDLTASAVAAISGNAPKSGWLDGAISGASKLAATLWDAAAAKSAATATAIPSGREGRLATLNANMTGRGQPAKSYGIPETATGTGGGGNGGGGDNGIQALIQSFQTKAQITEEWYVKNQAMLQAASDQELAVIGGKYAALEALEAQYRQKKFEYDQISANMTYQAYAGALGAASDLLSVFAGENKSAAIAVIAIQKGLAIAQIIMNTSVAQMRALAELGPIAGAAMAAKIGIMGKIQAGLVAATGLAQAGQAGKGGGLSGGVASAATAGTARVEPTKNILVNLTGPDFLVDMAESIIQQIYDASKDGRVIVSRG